ncbi:MAG TPA: ABC transporter ATP-binding protein [Limnochordia bacterium]|nr:ABC transporter ATP-binding protein [Limnochordia bacterium]
MAKVKVEGLVKKFGSTVAVSKVSFTVNEGELVTLLGPSGCGKTTTLRMIAGLAKPDEGRIYFGEERVDHMPPNARNIGMVFQNYALFPHMTVFNNVAFGLHLRKLNQKQIRERVMAMLELVQMGEYANRKPSQLSGGQQQRIAVARALAVDPDVLLLDEPLSNLDAKLREAVRLELRDLIKKAKKTTIFVTHDQIEALTLSDRIILMDRGQIVQEGTPEELYSKPKSVFAANFIGTNNFLNGVVEQAQGDTALLRVGESTFQIGLESFADPRTAAAQTPVVLVIRPEDLEPSLTGDPKQNSIPCRLKHRVFSGSCTLLVFAAGDAVLNVELPVQKAAQIPEDEEIYLLFDRCRVLPRQRD